MSLWESLQRAFGRVEIEEIDRGTRTIAAYDAQQRDDAERLARLRRSVADDRHPDLTAAIERRNAAR